MIKFNWSFAKILIIDTKKLTIGCKIKAERNQSFSFCFIGISIKQERIVHTKFSLLGLKHIWVWTKCCRSLPDKMRVKKVLCSDFFYFLGIGIDIDTSVPLLSSLVMTILPWNTFSIVCFAMASPKPVPPLSLERALSTR